MLNEGRYIYGITDRAASGNLGKIGIGAVPREVSFGVFDGISAIVSPSPVTKYPINRENLMIHQHVLEEVMKSHTVLPVRFCTIANEEGQVTRILKRRFDEFRALLTSMEGLAELGLKALWTDVPHIFKEIATEDREIKRLLGQIEKSSLPKDKEYSLKIRLGELAKKSLDAKKIREAEPLIRELRPLARQFKNNRVCGDAMFLNGAFLADKTGEASIDERVKKISGTQNGRVKLKYVGPVPIYNFIEIVIHWE